MERAQSGLNRRSILTGGAGLMFGGLMPACAQAPASTPEATAAAPTEITLPTPPQAVASLPVNPLIQQGEAGLTGRFVQGGYAYAKTEPASEIWLDGQSRGLSGPAGDYFIGFDRDAPPEARLIIRPPGQAPFETVLAIAPVAYDTQSVSGLPQETVTPTNPKVLERIAHDSALKAVAFQSVVDGSWFTGGFIFPLKDFRISGRFGNQRILNGVPKSPHYGFDMAAPTGTPIHAPQQGLVVLAEPDLFYEGGLTLIDHGQGLISMYLHQSKVDVKVGQIVSQGEQIGLVGARGRATGPHLCWRLKWRDRRLDPSLLVAPQAT